MGSRQVVVLVHGFKSDLTTWTKVKPAMLGAVHDADPANVYVRLFDYGSKSTQWVTDPAIGPALASFVRCLSQASTEAGGSGKVILVGHSMGGLAIRCALDAGCTPNPLESDKVGLVVTIGTPNAGSQIRPGAIADAATQELGASLLVMCDIAQITYGYQWLTESCQWVRALGVSPAGRAFTIGSHELEELAGYPAGIPVRAIAGAVTLQTGIGLWQNPRPIGDFIVSVKSQLLLHTNDRLGGTRTVDCGRATFGLGAACWHPKETAFAGIQSEVRQAVKDYLTAHPARPNTPLLNPVAINTTSIGDVKLGTLAGAAERRLRAILGRPDRVADSGCALFQPSERARSLIWGPLTARLSDRAPGAIGPDVVATALYSWQVGEGRSAVALTLPHGMKIGMSSVEVRTRATITKMGENLAGDLWLADIDGIEYDFDGVKEPTTLRSISYQVGGCE